MKKHRLLRIWYRLFIIPILLFLLIDRASALSVTNPDLYGSALNKYEVAEKLSPALTKIFEKQGFPEDSFYFSKEWVEGNLISLLTGFINWISGETPTLSLRLDSSELYYQLPQKIIDQASDDPGIIGMTIRAKGNTIDLADSMLSPDAKKAVRAYSVYMNRYYQVAYLLLAIIAFSMLLTPWRVKGDSRPPFIKYIGTCMFEYGLLTMAVFWGSYWYFKQYVSPDLMAKFIEDWQMAMYQGVFYVFKVFLNTTTILCVCFSAMGSVLLLADRSGVKPVDHRAPKTFSTKASLN